MHINFFYTFTDIQQNEFCRSDLLTNCIIFSALKQFGIFGVHIAPEDAIVEVNALTNVSTAGKAHWNIEVRFLI